MFIICLQKWFSLGFSGRAFEDIEASLSELHSFEGARRLQQRVCGPTVALSFNFLVSVGIIMMNKLVCILLPLLVRYTIGH